MIAGDFTGDGKLDLAVAYGSLLEFGRTGGVYVLLGNGDGTFQAPVLYAAGDNPASVVAGDFTGDGKSRPGRRRQGSSDADGKAVNGGVSLLIGNGNGTFQPPRELIEPNDAPQALVAGDFTGNGMLDLAVANSDDQQRLRSSRSTARAAPRTSAADPGGNYALFPGAGDFTGNGRLDLAVANCRLRQSRSCWQRRRDVSGRDGPYPGGSESRNR